MSQRFLYKNPNLGIGSKAAPRLGEWAPSREADGNCNHLCLVLGKAPSLVRVNKRPMSALGRLVGLVSPLTPHTIPRENPNQRVCVCYFLLPTYVRFWCLLKTKMYRHSPLHICLLTHSLVRPHLGYYQGN